YRDEHKVDQNTVEASGQVKNETISIYCLDPLTRPHTDLTQQVPYCIANSKGHETDMSTARVSGNLGRVRLINPDCRGVAKPFGFAGLDVLSARLSACHGKPVEMSATIDEIEFYIHNVNVISAT